MFGSIFSCYVSKTYHGDQPIFERIQNYFVEATRYTEEKWNQVKMEETEAVFAKGTHVAFTFDYWSPTLEVQAIINFDTNNQTVMVIVGNKGFPGEVHLAKTRYQTLLDKIDAYIVANNIAVAITAG